MRSLNPAPDSSQSGEKARKVETISYEADGLAMESLLYLDEDKAGPRPGVLVFPEAFGLGENAKTHAERLAELGYAALACDLHGEAKLYDDLATVRGLLEPMQKDPLRTRARAEGGLKALRASGSGLRQDRSDRILLRRHRGAGTGAKRRGCARRRRLSQRPCDRPAAGRQKHQGQGAGLPGRGRSRYSSRAACRL